MTTETTHTTQNPIDGLLAKSTPITAKTVIDSLVSVGMILAGMSTVLLIGFTLQLIS